MLSKMEYLVGLSTGFNESKIPMIDSGEVASQVLRISNVRNSRHDLISFLKTHGFNIISPIVSSRNFMHLANCAKPLISKYSAYWLSHFKYNTHKFFYAVCSRFYRIQSQIFQIGKHNEVFFKMSLLATKSFDFRINLLQMINSKNEAAVVDMNAALPNCQSLEL